MSSEQPDEAAILEVAREIKNDEIRRKYLSQVCDDPGRRSRLEQQARRRRRLQFRLRTLLLLMLIAGVMSALLGITINSAVRARQMAIEARMMAEMERQRAVEALKQAKSAALQFQAIQDQETAP